MFPTQPHPVYPTHTTFLTVPPALALYLCRVFILSFKFLFIIIILLMINGFWCCKKPIISGNDCYQRSFHCLFKQQGCCMQPLGSRIHHLGTTSKEKAQCGKLHYWRHACATASASELLHFKLIYILTFSNPLPAFEDLPKSRRECYKSHSTCIFWQIAFCCWKTRDWYISFFLWLLWSWSIWARYLKKLEQ